MNNFVKFDETGFTIEKNKIWYIDQNLKEKIFNYNNRLYKQGICPVCNGQAVFQDTTMEILYEQDGTIYDVDTDIVINGVATCLTCNFETYLLDLINPIELRPTEKQKKCADYIAQKLNIGFDCLTKKQYSHFIEMHKYILKKRY